MSFGVVAFVSVVSFSKIYKGEINNALVYYFSNDKLPIFDDFSLQSPKELDSIYSGDVIVLENKEKETVTAEVMEKHTTYFVLKSLKSSPTDFLKKHTYFKIYFSEL